jgi:hypothetical protein
VFFQGVYFYFYFISSLSYSTKSWCLICKMHGFIENLLKRSKSQASTRVKARGKSSVLYKMLRNVCNQYDNTWSDKSCRCLGFIFFFFFVIYIYVCMYVCMYVCSSWDEVFLRIYKF